MPVIMDFSPISGATLNNFFLRNLKRKYPVIRSGSGVWLSDTENRKYLDGCSGAVVSNIGHGVAEVNDAITEQLSKIAFVHSSQFVSESGLQLAEKLIALAPGKFNPGGRVYFVSGGSEAVETALKMARAYFYEIGLYQKSIVISRRNSYHGSTQGALAATGHPARRKPYLPILADSPHIAPSNPYRCPCGEPAVCSSEQCGIALADELENSIQKVASENVMAFIAEPVVGAAIGAAVPHAGYFKRIREICDRYGILLIADEVMTGMGRLGAHFGLSNFGVQADIIALGKGLSAGYMPLGAVLASAEIVSVFEQGSGVFEHGFTYSGHPVACAAGLAVLDYMQNNKLIERVNRLEKTVQEALSALTGISIVGNVRGKGFLWGIEFVCDRAAKIPFAPELHASQALAAEAAKQGLLIYPGTGCVDGVKGDHILFAPPYVVSEEELAEMIRRLAASLKKVAAGLPSRSLI